MIAGDLSNLFQAIGAALVFVAAGYGHYRIRLYHQVRLKQLAAVETALRKHYDAVEYMLADSEFPSAAREAVEDLADLVTDKSAGLAFGKALIDRDNSTFASSAPPQWMAEILALKERRQDLVSAFDDAMRSACAAMLLRWPENTAVVDSLTTDIIADSRKENAMRRRLADFIAANDTQSMRVRAA